MQLHKWTEVYLHCFLELFSKHIIYLCNHFNSIQIPFQPSFLESFHYGFLLHGLVCPLPGCETHLRLSGFETQHESAEPHGWGAHETRVPSHQSPAYYPHVCRRGFDPLGEVSL